MALPILDGNQTAATLSTIITGGAHIPAHTVVSLGSQAISDITSGVSGSVVSISNLPSTQTIAGTVTANSNLTATALIDLVEPVRAGVFEWADGELQSIISNSTPVISGTVTVGASSVTFNSNVAKRSDGSWQPLSVESGSNYVNANVQNSITIGSLPAISGTVTANTAYATSVTGNAGLTPSVVTAMPVALVDRGVYGGSIMSYDGSNTSLNVNVKGSLPAISGTVTVGVVSTSVTVAQIQGTSVTTSNFTSTTASQTLVSANSSRRGLTVFNEGAGNLHICAGATATTIAYQVRLSAGDYWECPSWQTALTHSAQFASTGTARIVEIL